MVIMMVKLAMIWRLVVVVRCGAPKPCRVHLDSGEILPGTLSLLHLAAAAASHDDDAQMYSCVVSPAADAALQQKSTVIS